LRPWAPFSCLLISSFFCPSSVFRESLGHSLSSGRPFCPSHPGLPCYPGILGLRAGATSRRSLFGRRSDRSLCPSPRQGWLPSDQERSRAATPSSGRPRRGGAAPAFVGGPTASLSAPRVLPWGLGNRSRLSRGPVSHEAGRLTDLVGQYYTLRYSTSDSICLYNVKNHKTCSGYLSVQIGRISSLFL
jgi:hypothetical protein